MKNEELIHSPTIAEIVEQELVAAVFQPIVRLDAGQILGYLGRPRGPSGGLLHSPQRLYQAALRDGKLLELENLGLKAILQGFVGNQLPGMLFLHLDLRVFSVAHKLKDVQIDKLVGQSGLDPSRVAIFISGLFSNFEGSAELLQKLVSRYGERGHPVAVDDIATTLHAAREKNPPLPTYLMLDPHLTEGIGKDPSKLKFIKSLAGLLRNSPACQLVAEGIDTRGDLLLLKEIGIAFGLGNFIGRPSRMPAGGIAKEALDALTRQQQPAGTGHSRTASIIEHIPCFKTKHCNEDVFLFFEKNPQATIVAVVDGDAPVGLINRGIFINRYARPFQRELFGKKPCTTFMDPEPLVVDKNISIHELSRLLADDQRHITMGFVFTDNGRYLGVGTSQSLIHEITEMQIQSARYANPLTGLPGNARIDEAVDNQLRTGAAFCLAYFDLDSFKPFNDVYGFSMGDAVIQMTAKIVAELCDAECDFVGHIGGDDFIVLFRSIDWESRCQAILDRFANEVTSFFSAADIAQGGYVAENRRGEKEFHTLIALSIGAVLVEPGSFQSHKEIAVVASESKKKAKQIPGNSLYVNQRHYPGAAALQENIQFPQ